MNLNQITSDRNEDDFHTINPELRRNRKQCRLDNFSMGFR